MFKRILLWGLSLLLLSNYASAQNFFISGGNAFSAVICGNGSVYTWGANGRSQLGRDLTGAANTDFTSVPGVVALPVEIKAIDAGSGAHVVALACNNQVWTWGANDNGQLGDGVDAENVSGPPPGGGGTIADRAYPVAVRAGVTNPSNPMDTLRDIVYVTSGTSQSYAITSDAKLLAWGANDLGQLGSRGRGWTFNDHYDPKGTGADPVTETSLPVYVIKDDLTPLENVIAVDAGDYHCYALVDDDDDGDPLTGRVYAWGGSAYGNPVISGALSHDGSQTATLVLDEDGEPLTGIYQITAGDASGFFIQKGTGFVFCVGSDDGGIRGVGPGFDDDKFAMKVASGDMENYTGDLYLSNVTGIAAGQASGLASVDIGGVGYLMSWGKNEPYYVDGGSTDGGYLGLGPSPTLVNGGIQTPRFVTFENGDTVKNVIGVSDGDAVSYAMTLDPITKDRRIYVFGNNNRGQLGLGDDNNTPDDLSDDFEALQAAEYYPKEFVLPPCKVGEPCPVADLGAATMKVCPGTRLTQELFAGSQGVHSRYKWTYTSPTGTVRDVTRDTSRTKGGAYLVARRLGTYEVEISDVRPPEEQTCEACLVVTDQIILEELDPPFDTVFNKFCGDTGKFTVNLDPSVLEYEFFNAETGGTSLGKGVKSGSKVEIRVPKLDAFDQLDALESIPDSIYSIWIEDQTITTGSLVSELASCGTSTTTGDLQANTQLFTVYKDVYFVDASVELKSYSGSVTKTFTPVIYSSGINPNSKLPIPNSGATQSAPEDIIWQGQPVAVTFTATAEYHKIPFLNMDGSKLLLEGDISRGAQYWIGLKAPDKNFNATLAGCGGAANWPYVDDITGDIIHQTAHAKYGDNKPDQDTEGGYLHNITLEKPTDYTCGRKELSVIKECPPCNGIEDGSLEALIGATKVFDTICDGGAGVSINFNAQTLSTVDDAATINYEWYHWTDGVAGSETAVSGADGNLKTITGLSNVQDTGYYIVKLYDNLDPTNGKCMFSDTVHLAQMEAPTYEFDGGQTLCDGDPFTDVTLSLTGYGPWEVTYPDDTKEVFGNLGDLTHDQVFTPTASADYVLKLIEDKYCSGVTTGGDTAKVVVNDLPTVVFADHATELCTDASATDISANVTTATPAGGTGVFSDVDGLVSATGVFTPATTPVTTSTTYKLTYTYTDLNGCVNSDDADITVEPLPVLTLTLNDKYCSEETIDFEAGATVDGAAIPAGSTYTFSTTPALALTGGSISAGELNSGDAYTFTLDYENALGCKASVTSDPTKGITVPAVASVVDYSQAAVLTPNATGSLEAVATDVTATLHWVDPTGVEMTTEEGNTSITVTHVTGTSHDYEVYQVIEGCVGPKTVVNFSTTACTAGAPVMADDYFCSQDASKTITATSYDATYQIAWLSEADYGTGFDGRDLTDATLIQADNHTISETTAGEYKYYVAVFDATPGVMCWSTASEVVFHVVEEPVVSISVPADDITSCYTDANAIAIPVSPAMDADGITPTFTIDGTPSLVNEFTPSNYPTGDADVELEYTVTKIITPLVGYTGIERSCAAITSATETLIVEYIDAPVIKNINTGTTAPFLPLVATPGTITGDSFNWYDGSDLSTATSLLIGSDEYNVAQAEATKLGLAELPEDDYKAYATQITANGCESEATEGIVTVIDCPWFAPVLELSANGDLFSICKKDIDASTPSVSVTVPSQTSYTGGATVYTWSDENGPIAGTSPSVTPTDLSVGTHTIYVEVTDNIPGLSEVCTTPPASATYTVHPQPVPSISGIQADMCVYDAAITLKGQDGGLDVGTVGSGEFSFNLAASEATSTYVFDPVAMGVGTHEINFEYTTLNGCTEKTTIPVEITIHEVPESDLTDADFAADVPQIADFIASGGVFTFNGQPTSTDFTLQWFTDLPGSTRPYTVPVEGTSPAFDYTLDPQPVLTPGPDEYTYTVYVNQKMTSAVGCESPYKEITFTTTDCPTPRPIVTPAEACDYWKGTDIPELKAESAPASAWPAGFTPDLTTSLEYRVPGTSQGGVSPTGTYQFTDVSTSNKTYEVEFRSVSDGFNYDCPSPWVTVELNIHTVEIPQQVGLTDDIQCFGDDDDFTFRVNTVPGSIAQWYTSTDVSLGAESTGPTKIVNGANGDQEYYASFKLANALGCESALTPAFTLDVLDPVADLTPNDEIDVFCSGHEDELINSLKWPSNQIWMTPSAQNVPAGVDVVWYKNETDVQSFHTGNSYSFSEQEYNTRPGVEEAFYIQAEFNGCTSPNKVKVVAKTKVTPLTPFITYSSSVQNGTVCEGDVLAEPPYYEAVPGDIITPGNWEWYNFADFDPQEVEKGNQPASSLMLHDQANFPLDAYVLTGGDQHFVVRQEVDGCFSNEIDETFSVGKIPVLELNIPSNYIYYCQNKNTRGVEINVKDADKKEGTITDVNWEYSVGDPIEEDEYQSFLDNQSKYLWFPKRVGIDYLTVELKNEDGCIAADTIVLYVAPKEVPSFDYEYYNGDQEIVFYNNAKETMVYDQIFFNEFHQNYPDKFKDDFAEPIDVKVELPTTYMWNFKYTEDGSNVVRPYPQMLQTYKDSTTLDYYVNKGPSNFYYNTKEEEEEGTKLIRVVEDKESPVTYYDGNQVANRGGVYFEYGASEVWLVRNVTGFESCKAESETENVFMEITTGLYLPSSLVPDHTSPLISVFKPYGHKLKDFQIWVFDNFGNTVWFSNQLDDKGTPTEVWDGRDKNGNLLPADCYTWKVDATFEDGKEWEGVPLENGKTSTIGTVCLLR